MGSPLFFAGRTCLTDTGHRPGTVRHSVCLIPGMFTESRIKAFLIAVALGLGLAGAPAAAAAPVPGLDVKVEMAGEEIRASVSLFVPAAQQRVWDVMTDFERQPEFMRDLEVSRVVSRSGDTLRVFQKSQVKVGPFAIPVETLRDLRLSAPARFESRLVSGSMKKYDATTELVRENGGTRIIVRSQAVAGGLAVFATESTIRRETEEHFRQLRAEILRREHVAAAPR